MSRRVVCDFCQQVIPWIDGQDAEAKRRNEGLKPALTLRGQGHVVDFCDVECLGMWAQEVLNGEGEG